MKTLKDLRKELKLKEELEKVLLEISELRKLNPDEAIELSELQDSISLLKITISRLESNVKLLDDELNVLSLPKEKQEDAWFELIKNCDFSKDSILRICSMLESDGLIPVFKSEGIHISRSTALNAYKLLCEHGFACLAQITAERLMEVKQKVRDNAELTEEDSIYLSFINKCDNNTRCAVETFEFMEKSLNNKFKESNNWEDRADYLVDRVAMALYHGGKLASGEKEFIAMYFNRDKI